MTEYTLKTYDELTKAELYDIMAHRQAVFLNEQRNIFHDLDYLDQQCWHMQARRDGRLIGYVRLLPEGLESHGNSKASFGRLSVLRSERNRGTGGELVKRALDFLINTCGYGMAAISAMAYLEKFYTELGFTRSGGIFDIEGVPHIYMEYRP